MSETPVADLVLYNARIVTMDDARPRADAVALRDGRIWRVGGSDEILAAAGAATERIDLAGRLVLPGLTDAHAHLMGLGERLAILDLTGTRSEAEILERVRARAAETPPGGWIRGRGWDQNDWPERKFPDQDRLNAAAPDHPVFLRRVDGHAAWVNARAFEAAGFDPATPDPEGGRILRAGGAPTGILIDNAMVLVEGKIPPPSPEEQLRRLENAGRACLAAGLTSVHDAGIPRERVDQYRRLYDTGRLKLRVYAMLELGGTADLPALGPSPLEDYLDGRLAVRSVKLYMDGALGSRGAALLEPYADDPGNTGLLRIPPGEIREITVEAMRRGYQVSIHAIGDRGNRLSLDAFEAALRQVPEGRSTRPRIEHAQLIADDDFARFPRLGVIASVQPTHCTSDMYWCEDRIGPERAAGAYAWRRLREAGARLACGSDFPVESEKPLWGLYAAVTRRDHEGWPEGGWRPGERMDLEEAIGCFTREAAWAAFEEDRRGSITPGKYGDLTVLDRDITGRPPEEILQAAVEMTIVGGEIVYRKN